MQNQRFPALRAGSDAVSGHAAAGELKKILKKKLRSGIKRNPFGTVDGDGCF